MANPSAVAKKDPKWFGTVRLTNERIILIVGIPSVALARFPGQAIQTS
jgi:hypothetical protein